jgi:hypothetical protein
MTEETVTTKAPWHLWVVGVLTLLWNGYGGYDYVMSVTNNADYMAMFTEEQRAYYASFPVWMTAAWAIAVWGGVLGSVLLLLRSKLAMIVYAIALAAYAVSCVYMYGMTDGARIAGQTGVIMSVVIGAIAVAELIYSWWMQKKGVLR